jgi:glycerol-3-phosphate acyltransferase PlsY
MGSLVVGRLYGTTDIRKAGSGNAGATNALRAHGKLFASWVLLIDVGKGILAVYLIPGLDLPGIPADPDLNRELVVYAVGFAAIVGHVFPIWFGFRGGKGGATAAGLLCFFALGLALPIIAVWVGIILLTGFVGLATMAASLAAVAYIGVTGLPEQHAFFLFTSAIAGTIVYTHRSNIRRMLDGTEVRIGRRFAAKR